MLVVVVLQSQARNTVILLLVGVVLNSSSSSYTAGFSRSNAARVVSSGAVIMVEPTVPEPRAVASGAADEQEGVLE